jgi:hypothetical protein
MNLFENFTVLYVLFIITIIQIIYLHYINNQKLIIIYIVVILTGFCINDNLIKVLFGAFIIIYTLIILKHINSYDTNISPIYHIIQSPEIYNESGISINKETSVIEDFTTTNFDIDVISKWNSMLPIVE